MSVLHLHLNSTLRLSMHVGDSPTSHYEFRLVGPSEDELIFYDWIADESGKVCGIEFHIGNEHHLITALRGRPYVAFDPFPRIMFRRVAMARPRGVEAFGDLWFLTTNDGRWLVVVGLDNWLESGDVDEINRLCNP